MSDPSELEQAIEENGTGPAQAQGDTGSMRQHSLRDQIEADKYLAGKRAVRGGRLPIRVAKIRPGSCV